MHTIALLLALAGRPVVSPPIFLATHSTEAIRLPAASDLYVVQDVPQGDALACATDPVTGEILIWYRNGSDVPRTDPRAYLVMVDGESCDSPDDSVPVHVCTALAGGTFFHVWELVEPR